jgi:DNA adenine methylase
MLFEGHCDHLILVEKDNSVASVWQTILSDDVTWLCEVIANFVFTTESVESVLARKPQSTRERAFQTILRNRINRGGIMAPRAGKLRSGENGRGVGSRWYPGTICRRIQSIHSRRNRITFIDGDGLYWMDRFANRKDIVWFIDPPYTAGGTNPGNRLYVHSEVDHDRLFKLAVSLVGDYLITYSDSDEVKELARWHGLQVRELRMRTTHHRRLYELAIGRKLDWLSSALATR